MHAGQATELWLPRFNRFDRLPGIFHFHDLLTYIQHSIHHGMELRCIPYTLPSLSKEVPLFTHIAYFAYTICFMPYSELPHPLVRKSLLSEHYYRSFYSYTGKHKSSERPLIISRWTRADPNCCKASSELAACMHA